MNQFLEKVELAKRFLSSLSTGTSLKGILVEEKSSNKSLVDALTNKKTKTPQSVSSKSASRNISKLPSKKKDFGALLSDSENVSEVVSSEKPAASIESLIHERPLSTEDCIEPVNSEFQMTENFSLQPSTAHVEESNPIPQTSSTNVISNRTVSSLLEKLKEKRVIIDNLREKLQRKDKTIAALKNQLTEVITEKYELKEQNNVLKGIEEAGLSLDYCRLL